MHIYIKNFSPINFFKKNNCFFCHKIKNNSKIIINFNKISYKYNNSFYNKAYLLKIIKNGTKNLKKNIIMPSFKKLKKKYIYLILKWILNIKNTKK